MLNFTFLTNKQIFGSDQFDILRIYGTKCAITDFSVLLGGEVASSHYTSEGEKGTGYWWTKTPYNNDVRIVYARGDSYFNITKNRTTGARVALEYSSISSVSLNGVRGINGVLEVEYGEYPQTVVSETFSKILETAFATMTYSNNVMQITGKSYTTDSVRYQDVDIPFQEKNHPEYEYNGKKYIRFIGDSNCSGEVLSDGRTVQSGDVYWIEVEPIIWMIDEIKNIALSKKIIFSGVQFNRERNYEGYFNKTDIKKYMDNYFSKDIIPRNSKQKLIEPYKLDEETNTSRITEISYDKIMNTSISDTKMFIRKRKYNK